MKLKVKNIVIFGVLVVGLTFSGMKLVSKAISGKQSDMEAVAINVLDESELISIKETVVDENIKKKYSKSNLTVSLHLDHSSPSIALDNALLKINRVMSILESTFEDKINDYKFIINTTAMDVYGNEQKVKILEVVVNNDDVDKINFEKFNYRNLEKFAQIKKFNYLKEYYDSLEENTQLKSNSEEDVKVENNDVKEN